MEIRKSLGLFIGIFCIILLFAVGPICNASKATISIKDVNVVLVETREPVGNRVIRVYDIIVILHNSGDIKSDEITVYFSDPEFNTTTPPMKLTPSNISCNPNENITFTMDDWPTPLSGDVPINISFGPSDSDVIKTGDNSGYYVYSLHIENNEKTTSTPGFEVVVVLGAILVLLLMKYRKK